MFAKKGLQHETLHIKTDIPHPHVALSKAADTFSRWAVYLQKSLALAAIAGAGMIRDLIQMERERQAKADNARTERQIAHLVYRQRMLPSQLERARARVAQLEREAQRIGFEHLLQGGVAQ